MAVDLEKVRSWVKAQRLHQARHPILTQRPTRYDEAVDHVEALVAEVEGLREALEVLLDEQNGPPLPTRDEQWFKAVGEANRVLGRGYLTEFGPSVGDVNGMR